MAHILAYLGIGAAHQNVRLDADGKKLLDRVLRGLALKLARAWDLYDERHMDIQHILSALFDGDLTDSLQKRLAFDIADRAADLAYEDIDIFAFHLIDAALYLVRHMRDYLHRAAEVGALPLTVEDIPIYLACRHA